jgi:hypothetical protein
MLNTSLADNYDTFTYNLHALLTAVNRTESTAIRSDSPWDAIDFDLFATALYAALRHSGQRVNRFGHIAGLELLFQAASQPRMSRAPPRSTPAPPSTAHADAIVESSYPPT